MTMSNVIFKRILYVLIAAILINLSGPKVLGPVMLFTGIALIAFALLVLPQWWNVSKFEAVVATIVEFPQKNIDRPIELEIANAKGERILFLYEFEGRTFESSRDCRWPSVFRPFAGNKRVLAESREGHRAKRPVKAYLQAEDPAVAYLTVSTDWTMVGVLVGVGILSVTIGLAFWL